MAEPKKRLTSTRSGKRRSHLFSKKLILSKCPRCQSNIPTHRVCPTCGFYKGKDILHLEEKAKAKEERRKKREEEELKQIEEIKKEEKAKSKEKPKEEKIRKEK